MLTVDVYGVAYMHHLTCGISSLLHSVNLILFTLLLVHLILRISFHHSHHLRSHHLSLPLPFTPDLKLISFTNPFLHCLLIPSGMPSRILNLYWSKWALALFLVSCAGLIRSHSTFESTLNSSVASYRPAVCPMSLHTDSPRFPATHAVEVYAWAGSVRNITCIASGVPTPDIYWMINDVFLQNNHTFHIFNEEGISRLQVATSNTRSRIDLCCRRDNETKQHWVCCELITYTKSGGGACRKYKQNANLEDS